MGKIILEPLFICSVLIKNTVRFSTINDKRFDNFPFQQIFLYIAVIANKSEQ